MPVSRHYRPDPLFASLGPDFSDPVAPANFPERTLRLRNQRWAKAVGLGELTPCEWENAFARFSPLPDNMSEPLAMRYHGHQFRTYNPDIGDGRGFLYAQLRDPAGRLLDLATKGSGRTPYSRFGDGRLTLKGGVREVLASALLEALGVYTSKAFSLFETGEALHRTDEPSPTRSAVLVRLSHSHIRIGVFQRAAYFERKDLIEALIAHVGEAYFPAIAEAPDALKPSVLLGEATAAAARLAASWMAAGFVHGVLNTDNMVVTGESFDYGPWRFLPASIPGFTAAYFDHSGLYAFARQPEATSWNLAQLAACLAMVSAEAPLTAALKGFAPAYRQALRDATFTRLGLAAGDLEADLGMLQSLFAWMSESGISWSQFFHDWFCGAASADRAAQSPAAAFYDSKAFLTVRAELERRAPVRPDRLAAPLLQRPIPVSLVIEEVEALWTPIAEADDWGALQTKLADIEALRRALALDGSGAPPGE